MVSLVGAVFSLLPIIGFFFALVLGITGIPLSGVGMAQAGKRGGRGKGLAIAGLVLGIVAIVMAFLMAAAYAAATRNAN